MESTKQSQYASVRHAVASAWLAIWRAHLQTLRRRWLDKRGVMLLALLVGSFFIFVLWLFIEYFVAYENQHHETALFTLIVLFVGALIGGCTAMFMRLGRNEAGRHAQETLPGELVRQVTARSEALNHYESQYRAFAELADGPILLCGPDYSIVYANQAAKDLLLGMGQDELSGQQVQSLLVDGQQALFEPWFNALWSVDSQITHLVTELSNRYGPACPTELSAALVSHGVDMRMQIVLHVRNENLIYEAELGKHLNFTQQLIEAIPFPFSMRDAQGRFVLVNRAFDLSHRTDSEELMGQHVFDVLPRGVAAAITRSDVSALQIHGPIDYEVRLREHEGQSRHLQVRVQAVRSEDDSLLGVFSVENDVTLLRNTEAQVTDLNVQLGSMAARLMRAEEDERRRIARDLHDQVGQILTALKMQLALIRRNSQKDSQALETPISMVEEALDCMRNLSAALHPHLLDDLGLESALRWLLDRFIRPTLPQTNLRCRLQPVRGPAEIELIAYRVVQEAVTNVLRHAQATRAVVLLEAGDGQLVIEVIDDGEGFDSGDTWFDLQRTTSAGIAGMRERVLEGGGDFQIESTPSAGTRLRAVLPWSRAH
jgi:two-component system, NarL family, sensor histidine kinase UhpB